MKRTVALVFAILMCFAFTGIASAEPADDAVDHKTETFIEELNLNPDGAGERAREKSKEHQSFVCLCAVSCWPEPHIWCRFEWCVGGGGCCSQCYWENCINNCSS
ncbi:MAG: hypothetical protein AAF481_16150 [Acidobacteriota bacterium]